MIQEWWNAFIQWFNSADGQRIVTGTILPFVAILAAGIIAAAIARRSIKRLLAQQERRYAASQVAALIASGRKAASRARNKSTSIANTAKPKFACACCRWSAPRRRPIGRRMRSP